MLYYFNDFLYSHKKTIKNILYLYSHFIMIAYSMLLGFFVFALSLFFFLSGFFWSFWYFFLSFAIFIIFTPYVIDLLSRGLYNYPFFAMLFVNQNNSRINHLIAILYDYVKFCFFINAFLFFIMTIFIALTLVHMLLFFELMFSLNSYIGVIILSSLFIPVAIEMFSYSWFNKTFYS